MHDTAGLQRLARVLGVFFTAIAALMSASAGWHFGGDDRLACILFAGLMGGLTVAVGYLLVFADVAHRAGRTTAARGIMAALVVCVVGEYASHTAFGTGHRAVNIEGAQLQNTRYDDGRASIASTEAAIKLGESRLAALLDANGWVAQVTADQLRAEARAEEMRGGCKQRCEGIKARIALAEERASLDKDIAAQRATLAKLRERSATTQRGESMAANQSAHFATVATMSLAPSASAVAWANIAIGGYISALSTGLGCLFNWLGHAVWRRKPDEGEGERVAAPAQPVLPPAPAALPLPVHMSAPGHSLMGFPTAIHTYERNPALEAWLRQPEVQALVHAHCQPAPA